MSEDELRAGGDAYERAYMPGEGDVLYRDKIVAPKWFHALMALPMLIVLITSIMAGMAEGWAAIWPLFVSMPLIGLLWLFFSVLRITVSREQVVVQYGLIGPKIAVKDIVSAEAVEYDWKQFGGWGIRMGLDGAWAYNMMGDAGQAVRIIYRDGAREHTIYVSTRHPAMLADAIRQAMRGEGEGEVVFDGASGEDEVALDVEQAEQAKRRG